mgnify:FL=1
MIELKGEHICERCGQKYSWVARRLEKHETVFGRLEDWNSLHISSFDITPYGYSIIGVCPNCGQHSLKNLAEK